jgi:hypothetical protein
VLKRYDFYLKIYLFFWDFTFLSNDFFSRKVKWHVVLNFFLLGPMIIQPISFFKYNLEIKIKISTLATKAIFD